MIAVTFYGVNNFGLPGNYPLVARREAVELLPGENELMSEEDYNVWKSELDKENAEALELLRNAPVEPSIVEVCAQIQSEAQRRIVAMLGHTPEQTNLWIPKQINMTARGSELVERKFDGVMTDPEQAELDMLKGFFAKVKAIRAFSNELESAWAGGQRPDIYSGWPF